jgi:hypothetical protein
LLSSTMSSRPTRADSDRLARRSRRGSREPLPLPRKRAGQRPSSIGSTSGLRLLCSAACPLRARSTPGTRLGRRGRASAIASLPALQLVFGEHAKSVRDRPVTVARRMRRSCTFASSAPECCSTPRGELQEGVGGCPPRLVEGCAALDTWDAAPTTCMTSGAIGEKPRALGERRRRQRRRRDPAVTHVT